MSCFVLSEKTRCLFELAVLRAVVTLYTAPGRFVGVARFIIVSVAFHRLQEEISNTNCISFERTTCYTRVVRSLPR